MRKIITLLLLGLAFSAVAGEPTAVTQSDPSELEPYRASIIAAMDAATREGTDEATIVELDTLGSSHLVDLTDRRALLEMALEKKRKRYGERSAEVAETMMLLAEVVDRETALEFPDDRDIAKRIKPGWAIRHEARGIFAENYGDVSCEVGHVDILIGLTHELNGDPHKAERLYRSVIEACPPIEEMPETSEPNAGWNAEAMLAELLQKQERYAELEAIEGY